MGIPASLSLLANTGPMPSITSTGASSAGAGTRNDGGWGSREMATEMKRSRIAQITAAMPAIAPKILARRFMSTGYPVPRISYPVEMCREMPLCRVRGRGTWYLGSVKVDFYFAGKPPQHAAEAAREAKRLGYSGFFTAETQYDPFFPLLVAGMEEPDLDLGTAIAVAFPRSPMVLAYTVWDLARLSGGKFLLGLGTQVKAHITRRFSTPWDRPVARLRDYILALRAIWDAWQNSTPLRYKGEFYEFSLMTPFFDPGPIPTPTVPVYIAGVGPGLSRMAGEVCDGFHVHPFHTVKYLDQVVLPAMREGAESAGRTLDDVTRATTVFIATGHDDAEVEQAMAPIRQQIAFYASTPSYHGVLEASGFDIGEQLHAMSKRGQWAEMAELITDEIVAEVGIVGTIDEVGKAIKERYGDRIQRVGFYTLGGVLQYDPDAQAQVIADLAD